MEAKQQTCLVEAAQLMSNGQDPVTGDTSVLQGGGERKVYLARVARDLLNFASPGMLWPTAPISPAQ